MLSLIMIVLGGYDAFSFEQSTMRNNIECSFDELIHRCVMVTARNFRLFNGTHLWLVSLFFCKTFASLKGWSSLMTENE